MGSSRAYQALREGATLPGVRINIRSGQTEPPQFLKETELIDLMDKHGVGTDASMATHIENV